ncbi:hypothetical protein GCAAIG_07830 [Candidatus Electronema halotolerans]
MLTIYKVCYKNLLRKKLRSSLTIIGVGLSAWVLASLMGFNKGYEASLNRDIDNMGFQVVVTAKGCPYEAATLMLKGGGTSLRYMKEGGKEEVDAHEEVERTTPMLMQAIFDPNKGGFRAGADQGAAGAVRLHLPEILSDSNPERS